MAKRIRSYRDLIVWQKSIDLVDDCYSATRGFPSAETYGLTSQIRRASVSIAANIAEGHGRTGPGQYLHQLSIARGSLRELETLLLISRRQRFVKAETFRSLAGQTDEIGRMLYGLTTKVEASNARGAPASSDPTSETTAVG
jgi:four helix bundle protein